MGKTRYKFKEEHYPYFVTCSTVKGISLFAYQDISKLIIESIKHLQNKEKVELYAYVIMHNHIHLIVEGKRLAIKMGRFKSFTARCIIDYLKAHNRRYYLSELIAYKHSKHKDSEYQVWQKGVHPKQISDVRMMNQKIEYVHCNPVKAGFVNLPQHWKYSSARNYLGEDNAIIPVTLFSV
ncbi:MAG: transposase [Gracilimonas sp.]|uniref:REP-associated tyrosine transposase n=1 Tax=Gracilimonas sp. TaxID=1974203 RepID=UPI0019B50CD5|nr:transposase [Gracilimonas sp.]MBD3614927.1 transposase [Gracilimonas sp.]